MATAATDAPDPLSGAYRVVRRLTVPDSPYPGLLARDGSDAVVLIDPDLLPGASREPDRGPHVLQPSDIARTAEGTLLVMPWCVDRAETVLRRAETLSAGEAITVAVSIHRGLRALAPVRDEPEVAGSWWVTDAGCPAFARSAGAGALPVTEASHALWSTLAEVCAPGPVRDALARTTCSTPEVESILFALGHPEPVPLSPVTRRRVEGLPRMHPTEPGEVVRRGGLRELVRTSLARHVDADLAATVSDTLHGMRKRLRSAPRPPARRSLVFAGVAATAVIAVGLLWPSTAPDATAGDRPRAPAASLPSDAAPEQSPAPVSPTPAASATPDVGSDPVSVLTDLLRRAAGCEASATCGEIYEPGADTTALAAASALPATERSIELLDDLGGVAVLRITAADAADSTIVVIVQVGTSWLVRDVRSAPLP